MSHCVFCKCTTRSCSNTRARLLTLQVHLGHQASTSNGPISNALHTGIQGYRCAFTTTKPRTFVFLRCLSLSHTSMREKCSGFLTSCFSRGRTYEAKVSRWPGVTWRNKRQAYSLCNYKVSPDTADEAYPWVRELWPRRPVVQQQNSVCCVCTLLHKFDTCPCFPHLLQPRFVAPTSWHLGINKRIPVSNKDVSEETEHGDCTWDCDDSSCDTHYVSKGKQ